MALSWNEIKDRALKFSNEWIDETRERAEKDSFWNDFFEVFGISRRRVATFEEPVKKLGDKQGFIDLFWKGTLLVEHKSKGKNLDKAYEQATDYFPGLKEHELPKYILVSDFERIKLFDLDERTEHEFHISEFYKNVKLFGFIAGYQKRTFKEEDPVNIKAAELMGKLHDQLKEFGYKGHPLEVYLVRLLFVLFADDTGIFEKDIFKEFIDQKTNEDGSDLGALLAQFFQVLNTPNEKRLKNLDEHLNQFPYVNGGLFEEFLPIAAFNSKMRKILLEASGLDWGKISPAIFGSLFQSVMNPEERRNLGAHYTSEKNIFKLIKPLFLDELRKEFEKVKSNSKRLKEFHKKLSTLKFLDPACGSGNFLIITYRELRLLEIDILRVLYKNTAVIDISHILWLNVDQFYGIEYDEFASKIAEVAMWLIDHQMNMRISEEFGQYFIRLPLTKSAKIIHGNALRIDWNTLTESSSIDIAATQTNIINVNEPITHYETINIYTKGINISKGNLPIEDKKWKTKNRGKVNYILGNPPFYGKQYQNKEQKEDMKFVFDGVKGAGVLDYVTAWYLRASQYIRGTDIKVAFVSTNSISQGEQVGVLWNELFNKYGIKINFAHRTFNWKNEAKGSAAVHVVIIGFANFDTSNKFIFEYENIMGEPHEIRVKNINPYLFIGSNIFIQKRSNPICSIAPKMIKGSMPNDNGYYLFNKTEMDEFLVLEPKAKEYFKKFIGGREFINNIERFCLWLKDIEPSTLNSLHYILTRVEKVKQNRIQSKRKATQKGALTPTLFGEDRQPNFDYLALPEVSSQRRQYLPIGYYSKDVIASNKVYMVPNADLFTFGLFASKIFMIWIKNVSGRLKSDFSISTGIVYNNFPWPKEPSEKNKKKVEEKAQKILDVKAEFTNSSLADLYDPLTMPPKLVKAHQELDKAVDLCYRSQTFTTENTRIEFLFDLYNEYTSPMFNEKKK